MIDFACRSCGEQMSVPGCLAGQTDTCPVCKAEVTVPPPGIPIWRKPWFIACVSGGGGALLCLIVILAMLPGTRSQSRGEGGAPTARPTLKGWGKALEAQGWVLKEDKMLQGNAVLPDMRLVSYTKSLGDLKLGACIWPSTQDGRIYSLSLDVRGPFDSRTAPAKGYLECRRAATRLIPGAAQALQQAVKNFEKRGDKRLEQGLERLEGQASTPGGWEVTCVEYLVGLKNSRDDAKVMIHFLRRETTGAAARGGSGKVEITGIGHKPIDSNFGHKTVAWKATIRNKGDQAFNYTVEAVFIDMERFELARDFRYGVVLLPDETRTVSGKVMMKADVYSKVANLLVKVSGYPVGPRRPL